MSKITKIFIFILSICAFFAFPQIASAQGGMETFSESGVTFQYPAAFKLSKSFPPPILFSLTFTSSGENINMACENLPSQMSCQEYAKLNINNITSLFKLQVENQRPFSVGGYPAVSVTYSGSTGQVQIKQEQIYVVVGNRGYAICISGTDSSFMQAKQMGYRIINTMKFEP